jgi:aryl-phospho-beta-D-glucosidase BglC (GH1 family)
MRKAATTTIVTSMSLMLLIFTGLFGQTPDDFIRRQGNRLVVGAEEKTIFLRGINLDYEFLITDNGDIIMDDPDDQGRPMFDRFAESDYQRIASMCMNAIRVLLNYRLFEDNANPFVYKDEVWPWLDQQIQWAKNQGLYLILDMHVPPGGLQPSGGGGASQWDDPVKQQRFKALWYAIAERYKDETTLAAYDLMNEPQPSRNTDQWKTLAQATIDTIRSVDANHLILLEEVNWIVDANGFTPGFEDTLLWQAQEFQILVDDDNVMYDFHFYQPQDFVMQLTPWVDPTDQGSYPDATAEYYWEHLDTTFVRNKGYLEFLLLEKLNFSQTNNVPVFVGEFTPSLPTFKNDKGGDRYLADLLDLLLQYNANFTYYTYHALFEDYDGLPDTVYNAIEVLTEKYCAPVTSIRDDENSARVQGFALYTNYPNPFNPGTRIRYDLSERTRVVLKIYDVLGRVVRTLVNEVQNSGSQSVAWDGRDHAGRTVSSGVYVYRLQADGFTQSRKMLLLR